MSEFHPLPATMWLLRATRDENRTEPFHEGIVAYALAHDLLLLGDLVLEHGVVIPLAAPLQPDGAVPYMQAL